jgi:hypothetical protein
MRIGSRPNGYVILKVSRIELDPHRHMVFRSTAKEPFVLQPKSLTLPEDDLCHGGNRRSPPRRTLGDPCIVEIAVKSDGFCGRRIPPPGSALFASSYSPFLSPMSPGCALRLFPGALTDFVAEVRHLVVDAGPRFFSASRCD